MEDQSKSSTYSMMMMIVPIGGAREKSNVVASFDHYPPFIQMGHV